MLAWKLHPFWERKSGISEKASVHPSVSIGERVTICEFASVAEDCVIEDDVCIYPGAVIYPGCTLGSGTIIHAGAVIREETKLGAEVIIQSGAVIGGDGFGYYPGPEGLEPVPQVGNVVLADRVDIGSNACVDRATFGSTRIGSRTKIDNLVQVGHNTKIGMNSIVCGLSGISGSCKIGNGVTLAGGVGVADQVSIEDGAVFAARSGLGTVKHYATGVYSGFPAMSASRWRRREVLISRLPELFSSKKDAEQGGASERRRSFGK
ncbi:UNVERIFIED_CONTAM: hypothetical protein GTU68_042966 [Idotea baltica]|nr:hypothetical protein [Idotea baltica]